MNNKTNIEEDIKKINDYIHDWQDNLTDEDGYSIETLDEDSEKFIKAIENILADRERVLEENRALREDYQTDNQYYEELIKDKIEELEKEKQEKRKILDEINIVISKKQGTETDLDSAYQYYDETYDEMQKLTYQINILQELIYRE